MSKARKVAEEIVGVLKYNPELSDSDKILAVEIKLDGLINDIEEGAKQVQRRLESEPLLMEAHGADREAILNSQPSRGPLN